MSRSLLALLLFVCLASMVPAQVPSEPASDHDDESVVIERMRTIYVFQDDGTGKREQSVRLRMLTQGGVQQFGQLVFGYNAHSERMEIAHVRVTKPDGTVVLAPTDAIQDVPDPVVRQAPVYTDYRQKHVTVPALRPGDILEYELHVHMHTALAPGHFWMEHNFQESVIVLDELLEVSVPRARDVRLKVFQKPEPEVTEKGGRRLYRWQWAFTKRESEEERREKAKKAPRFPAPDVQIATFAGWDEVARWYDGLQRERVAPTPEIRARAQALITGIEDDAGKVRALYEFVSGEYRYVSLSFGIGRFQPHPAAEVLENKYGDCKDKHTLLASLLQAAGFEAHPVLIHSSRRLDPDLPSPSQFDHLITAVRLDGEDMLLDTTPGVAPFGLLTRNLRGKQALLVDGGKARLIETGPHPPFEPFEEVTVEGAVDELGKLTARVRLVLRGDSEVLYRHALQQVPRAQWKVIGNLLAANLGIAGETENFRASDPLHIDQPFWLEYEVAKNAFLDWSSRRSQLGVPLPSITLPVIALSAEEHPEPFEIGGDNDVRMRVKLELPPGFTPRAPAPISVKRDYGEYTSRYEVRGQVITAERRLRLRERELAPERTRDFIAFRRAVTGDHGQQFSLERLAAAAQPSIPEAAKADDLHQAGHAAVVAGNHRAAIDLLKRAVELEPKHRHAWNNLGRAYLGLKQYGDAIEALEKQIEVSPFDEYAYNNLGLAYWRSRKYEEAAEAFRKQIEVHPLDRWASNNLGLLLLERKNYGEAAEALERAASVTPNNAGILASLGRAYLNLEQPEKALEAFEQAVKLQPDPTIWNNVAYELAVHDMHLDRARSYAESAVSALSAQLRMLDLERLQESHLGLVEGIASFWDTLGWVYFRQGDLDRAERFIEAAWLLGECAECGVHLGEIYEKRGLRDQAIRTYSMAMYAARRYIGTRDRLVALVGELEVDAVAEKHRTALSERRTIKLRGKPKQASTADFILLFGPGPEGSALVEQVRHVSGAEELRSMEDELRRAQYPVRFPDDTQLRLVRRGTLTCSPHSGCFFVLLPLEATRLD